MRVTVIDSDVSYPPTSGKRLRTLNLMLPLARRHTITYIGRSLAGRDESEAQSFLRDHGIKPIIVPEPLARKAGPVFYARLARNLVDSRPYSVALHETEGMRAAVARHLANGETDLCQIEFCGYLYTTASYGGPRVLQAHNVESTIWRRFAENESSAARRWFMRRQHDKYLKYEGWAFRDVERVIAVSRTDAETIASLYGDLPVDVVDNGVDVAAFGSVQRQPDPHRILFLGALDWRPNQDAVDWLLTEIFPAVRREVPQAELTIVGRHPPASLVQRAAEAVGIHLFADVPDVRPHLAASAVMSVPLRIGGGSRLKILESLAAGVPVVSTQVGAEGLNLVNDVHLTVADSGEHHARALIEALSKPARYEMQAAAGRAEVAETYGWPRLAERLERSWESARARRNPHRSRAAAEASEVANPLD